MTYTVTGLNGQEWKLPTKAALKAFQLGRKARRNNEPRHNNPYHCTTSQAAVTWNAWFSGYDAETSMVQVKS